MTERQRDARPNLAFSGVLIMVASAGVRLLASFDPVPVWGGDPLTVPVPITGLTPVGSLIVDFALVLGATLAAVGAPRPTRGVESWSWVLLIPGALVAAHHASPDHANALDNLVQGSAWTAALGAAWAARNAASDPRCRRTLAAGLYAFLAILLLKGLTQFFIEHPRTLEAFRADKAAFLTSQGWSEDSPMARAYERRVSQPEATGWFGMANVYAGVMGAAAVVAIGAFCAAWSARTAGNAVPTANPANTPREQRTASGIHIPTMAVLLLAVGCGAVGVALAGSKGGHAFLWLGVVLLLLARAWQRPGTDSPEQARNVWGDILGLAVPLAVTSAVVVRGLLGTRIGELSVLFRWFYLDAAARIAAEHPLGTGPASFKDAYMLAKNPLSPEDVSSPHCLPMDWAASLGVGGLAWGALWFWWLAGAGRRILARRHDLHPLSPLRPDAPWYILALAAPIAIGAQLEADVATPDGALVRVGGLVLGVVIALAIAATFTHAGHARRWLDVALGAGALVLAASAQFDLTGSAIGSVAWVALAVALGSSPERPCGTGAPRRFLAAGPAFVPALSLAVVLGLGQAWRAWAWESAVRAAGAEVAGVGEISLRARQLSVNRADGDSWPDLIAALSSERRSVGLPPANPANAHEFHRYLGELRSVRVRRAIPLLERAAATSPSHLPTVQALTRLILSDAIERGPGDTTAADAERALALARTHADRFPSASAWGWLGTLAEAGATTLGRREWLVVSTEAWERAASLSPCSVIYPSLLARAHAALGRPEEARRWAQRALDNDANMTLDPLQGLSERVREEMRRLAVSP